MIKTQHIRLKLSHEQTQQLKEAQMECARCWNEVVKIANEYYQKERKWISKYDIQSLIAGKFNLQRHNLNAITDKYAANRKTISELRKQGNKKARYPYKEKRFFCIPFKKSAILDEDGFLKLTIAQGNQIILPIPYDETIKSCEIIWRDGYVLSYQKDYPSKENTIVRDGVVGVDLGEIHAIAACTEFGEGLIISHRHGRSLKQKRNKVIAYVNKRLSRCQKGSRMYQRLIKLKQQIKLKTKRQLRDLYHQITAQFMRFCDEKAICEIILGDLKNVGKNTKKKKKLNRNNRQKMSQMEFGTLKDYIQYKAKERGISVRLVNESYTSQTCPHCGKRHKPANRNFECSCGYYAPRDLVGAWNILNKKYSFELKPFIIQTKQPLYLKPKKYRPSEVVVA